MNKAGTLILTVILFTLGIVIVFLNPIDPMAISFGMFLVAVSVLSVAIQIYFPATPSSPVELRVVERRVVTIGGSGPLGDTGEEARKRLHRAGIEVQSEMVSPIRQHADQGLQASETCIDVRKDL